MLADQLIFRLYFICSRGIIHRDIKPENFFDGYGVTRKPGLRDGLGPRHRTSYRPDQGQDWSYIEAQLGGHSKFCQRQRSFGCG